MRPGRAGASALSMVWLCWRVARPLSSGVKVGRALSQSLGSSRLMSCCEDGNGREGR